MAKGFIGATGYKAYLGATKMKAGYIGATRVYSAGSTVTYVVDNGVSYTEEVDSEASCLSPKSFTPTKSGWTFWGWRQDTSPNGNVLTSLVMEDHPITLYAVYAKSVTVTYYNENTGAIKDVKNRYYNSGSITNPTFTLHQTAKSGWTPAGWAVGNGSVAYSNGTAFTRDSDITLYGKYNQTITVTYYNGTTSAASATGTRSYYSGTGAIVNPTFTLYQAALTGWTARGWSTSTAGNGGITYANGAAFTRDSNITLYGMYQQTITLTYYNGNSTASTTSGTRYYNPGSGNISNPTFTLTPASLSGWTFRGWATSSAAAAGIAYSSISNTALGANTTVYAAYSQTITLSYNGNGATSGSIAAQTGTRYWNTGNVSNPSFTLQANAFTRPGYTFSYWALNGGTAYSPGAVVTLETSASMYAAWVAQSYYAYQNGVTNTAMGISNPYFYVTNAQNGRYYATPTIESAFNAIGFIADVYCDANKSGPITGICTGWIPTNGLSTLHTEIIHHNYTDRGGIGTPYYEIHGLNAAGADTTLWSGMWGYNDTGGVLNRDIIGYTHICIYLHYDTAGGSSGLNKKIFFGIKEIRLY